jgi:hypothetical protein
MNNILLALIFLAHGIGFSQSDSLRYWENQKRDAQMKIAMGGFSHLISSFGVISEGWKSSDGISQFVLFSVPAIFFDTWGIIQYTKAIKNIKRIKEAQETSDG